MLGSAKEKHLIAVMEWIIYFLRSAFFYEEIETKSVWIYGIDGKKHYEGHQNFPRPRLKKEADSSNIISRVFIKGTEHKTIRAARLDG